MTATMEKTTEPHTVTMRGRDLGRVLSNATLAVSKDDTRPVLQCLHITIGGGRLTVEATDSYMLIEDSAPLGDRNGDRTTADDSASWSGLIMADSLTDLRKRLLSRESYPREVSITFRDDDKPNGSIRFEHDGTVCTFQRADVGDFPNTAQLWPTDDEGSLDNGRICIRSDLLAKLPKIIGPNGTKGNALAFTFRTKDKPFIIRETVSDSSFRALVMPYRGWGVSPHILTPTQAFLLTTSDQWSSFHLSDNETGEQHAGHG